MFSNQTFTFSWRENEFLVEPHPIGELHEQIQVLLRFAVGRADVGQVEQLFDGLGRGSAHVDLGRLFQLPLGDQEAQNQLMALERVFLKKKI